MVIYADVLVGTNIIITYIFILSVRLLSGFASNRVGVALASALGGVSALIVFLGEQGLLFSVVYRLIIASLIVLTAFLPRKIKSFIKLIVYFFGITLLCGGCVYGVIVLFSPQSFMLVNGTVYFDMSIKLLVGVTGVVYGAFYAFDYFFLRHASKNSLYPVIITLRGVSVHLTGFVDTGNNLKDGFSQSPVFVAELRAVAPLLLKEETEFFERGITENPPDSLRSIYRLLPLKTVSGNGLIGAIKPDSVAVESEKAVAESKEISIAIVTENLSDGEYSVLLNKSVFDMNWKELDYAHAIKRKSRQNKNIF